MANITVPAKSLGDQHTAAELNEQVSWINSPTASPVSWNPNMTFDSQLTYNAHTLTSNEVWEASSIVNGIGRALQITTNGLHKIFIGVGITNVIGVDVDEDNDFILAAGTYWAYFYSFVGGVHLSIPEASEVAETGPSILSISLAADNTFADVTFNTGIYGANDGSTPAALADLSIVFAQSGGTATAWTESSAKQNDSTSEGSASALAGGETIIRVFGAITGVADGNETLTVNPTDSASLYDSAGTAISDAETSQTNFNIVIAYEQWLNSENVDTGEITEYNNGILLWQDKSTNNRDGAQSTEANRPLIETALINNYSNKQRAIFDGSTKWITTQIDGSQFATSSFEVHLFISDITDGHPASTSFIFGAQDGTSRLYLSVAMSGQIEATIGNLTDGQFKATTNDPLLSDGQSGKRYIRLKFDFEANQTSIYSIEPASNNTNDITTSLALDPAQDGDLTSYTPANYDQSDPIILGGCNVSATPGFFFACKIVDYVVTPKLTDTQANTLCNQLVNFNY
jgi:hypothetical protein